MKIRAMIKDFINVKKYKRKINTLEVKVQSLSDEHIELLKSDRSMLDDNIKKTEQIRDLKKEVKELKRVIEEDMIPKKKKKSN